MDLKMVVPSGPAIIRFAILWVAMCFVIKMLPPSVKAWFLPV